MTSAVRLLRRTPAPASLWRPHVAGRPDARPPAATPSRSASPGRLARAV